MSNTLKAMFFNGSPRKQWTLPSSESHQAGLNGRVVRKEGVANTAKMLESTMKGAEEAGAECELVLLYDFNFHGCKSCFACKIKNSKTNGICAIRDDLRPVLERVRQADVVVLGSPVYYSFPTGDIRSFMERWLFPVGTYMYEKAEDESNGHSGRHISPSTFRMPATSAVGWWRWREAKPGSVASWRPGC